MYADSKLRHCADCGLHATCTMKVFPSGMIPNRIMIIGEAPGEDEDKIGIPFVGRSGRLLSFALNECGLNRSQVYVTNVVKCRPKANHIPADSEIQACLPYLQMETDACDPKIILLLGKTAYQAVVETVSKWVSVCGTKSSNNGVTVMPVYHPAYVLRNMHLLDKWVVHMKTAIIGDNV